MQLKHMVRSQHTSIAAYNTMHACALSQCTRVFVFSRSLNTLLAAAVFLFP